MNADQFPGGIVMVEGRRTLNDLHDEILIEIFKRIIDLKTLRLCSLASRRFSSLILCHVHSVYYAVPRRRTTTTTPGKPATVGLPQKIFKFLNALFRKHPERIAAPKPFPPMIAFYGDFFCSALNFLREFRGLRSLNLILPSSARYWLNPNADSIFKWTAKAGSTIDTFVFICASSIRVGIDEDHEQEPQDPLWNIEVMRYGYDLGIESWNDAIHRNRLPPFFFEEHPLLENITITDSKNVGSLCFRESEVVEMRNWLNSLSETEKTQLQTRTEDPGKVFTWRVPVLKLPMSRKVIKDAILVFMKFSDQDLDLDADSAEIARLFEQEEQPLGEAIVEIMLNHNIDHA